MQGIRKSKKGFTLIELLVVIAIIAILSVVVILTLNPAELLRQSRDSNRVSDMSVLKSAVGYFLATANDLSGTPIGTSTCYESAPVGSATSTCITWFKSQAVNATTTASSTAVDGTGWVPIKMSNLTGGSPLGALPQDPLTSANTNDKIHIYTYIASSSQLTFKIDTHMESLKYSQGGNNDVVSTDGGNDPASYEQGTNLGL